MKKKSSYTTNSCRTCHHAQLVQSRPGNPVLAWCTLRPDTLYPNLSPVPYHVEVASCPACDRYQPHHANAVRELWSEKQLEAKKANAI